MSPGSELVGDQSNNNGAVAFLVPSPPPVLSPSSPCRKTMEDVWGDISRSIPRDHDPVSISGAILQDFIWSPFQRNWAFAGVKDSSSVVAVAAPFDCPASCLNSNSNSNSGCPKATRPGSAPYLDGSSGLNAHCQKRGLETKDESWDRRHKRLIKNRESAARSRARRQAYTIELELEVERLRQENAKLRKQQEKLFLQLAPASDQIPKKNRLHRTLTGPF
ncbi:hypothetical protein CRG98_004500 [Punica granatum]|uniref:BZIP domain-containing protein n=1 Tax=Punica granatum TaxID=22663 RepID=A0A2I0L377_PUNGR|nr:hypothetical protein CRG98_004500 [Punica granatum]